MTTHPIIDNPFTLSLLYNSSGFSKEFVETKLNLSAVGIGISIEKAPPVSDYETAIEKMLEVIKKKKRKVLIVIHASQV